MNMTRNPSVPLLSTVVGIGCVVAAILFSGHASADPEPVPQVNQLDRNGVDVTRGSVVIAGPSVSIGAPGAGQLTYTETFIGGDPAHYDGKFGGGWRPNQLGTINYDSTTDTYWVSLEGRSERFRLFEGSLVSLGHRLINRIQILAAASFIRAR